jgi:predicted phosphodiesterase
MNNNQRIMKVVAFLKAKPSYIREPFNRISKQTGETNSEIVRLAKEYIKAENKSIDEGLKPYLDGDPNNVLVVADTHFPFEKEGYLAFCRRTQEEYDCGTIVHIGDEVDLCAISQWEKDPDGFSAGNEVILAQEKMNAWYKVFPEVFVCIGNHTARIFRTAKTAGIPKKFIKSYEEAWNAPLTWKWSENWEFNNVLYTHGTGFSGANAAIRIAQAYRQNVCCGHIHSEAGIQYNASKKDLIWGLQVGGALDDKTYAAAYAKDQLKKSIVGCGVVLNGKLPLFIPMNL